jgi:hypothetical protein
VRGALVDDGDSRHIQTLHVETESFVEVSDMTVSAMAIPGTLLEHQVVPTLPWARYLTGPAQVLHPSESRVPAKSLLLFGQDVTLAQTRSLILRAAGFTVHIAKNSVEAERLLMSVHLDLFVFCHSVPFEEASGVLSTIHAVQRKLKTLVLVAVRPSLLATSMDDVHNTSAGPRALILKIRSMVASNVYTH